jgi:hypothetical protein
MPKYIDLASQAGESVIGAIETAQGAAVSAVETATQTIGTRLPKVPSIKLPEAVPTPTQVAETTFSLAERVLASQKRYTLGLIGAFKPLAPEKNGKTAK